MLLDKKYRTKVSNFGILKFIAINQIHLATCKSTEHWNTQFRSISVKLVNGRKPIYRIGNC